MRTDAEGLVITEKCVGDSDRLITILTKRKGILRAFVQRPGRAKDGRLSATRLFSYSRFTIFEGRDKYIIDDARPIEVFFDLRKDIGRLSLAQYFCELSIALAPQDAPAEEYLSLVLNALYLLGRGDRPNGIVKAVVEMRMLALSGYQPDLVGCAECGKFGSDPMWFLPVSGRIVCNECGCPQGEPSIRLGRGAMAGLRHTIYAEPGKAFSFSLSRQGTEELARAAEAYVLSTLGRGFATLDFYHATAGETGWKG
ncbi:DNA repair protein RecO [Caproiciproducens sp. NJN-50]|uniref:DNA repair protein RecO n=1 Tax=Caproiciproducens sp. NJN-50 TaxID=2507162 RepID=UPI000FFE0771|nr:DNA repair protein RecO [Caproiciproducens sp. NJN-50]QAT50166.1 DNA repair protein RecO [Caproiciproducens sp. NJN-50]